MTREDGTRPGFVLIYDAGTHHQLGPFDQPTNYRCKEPAPFQPPFDSTSTEEGEKSSRDSTRMSRNDRRWPQRGVQGARMGSRAHWALQICPVARERRHSCWQTRPALSACTLPNAIHRRRCVPLAQPPTGSTSEACKANYVPLTYSQANGRDRASVAVHFDIPLSHLEQLV